MKSGQDIAIEGAINRAKKEYIQYRQRTVRNFSELENPEELEEIAKSVIFHLQSGIKFLKYEQFLKEQLKIESLASIAKSVTKGSLKVKQIALIYAYEGNQITRANAGEIAANYGYTSVNSGEGLFQDYTTYSSPSYRKEKPTPCTPKKLKNKIELFESIIEHLSNRARKRAEDEIMILKTIFENEYQ
jgi:hypothetical protein